MKAYQMRKWYLEFTATAAGQSWPLYAEIVSPNIHEAFKYAGEFCDNSVLECECTSIMVIKDNDIPLVFKRKRSIDDGEKRTV